MLDNDSGRRDGRDGRGRVPGRPADRLDENLGFARGVQPAAGGGARRVRAAPQPGHRRARGRDREPRRLRASPSRARPLRRADARPRRTVNPGSCWGAPTLWSLFCFATMLSTAFKGSRSSTRVARRLAARQRPRGRTSSPAASCSPRARSGRSSAASTRASSCTARTPTSRCARPALGYRPAITPDAVVTHEIGVSSVDPRGQADPPLPRQGDAPAQALARPRLSAGLVALRAGVGLRALLAVRGAAGEGPATWREVWRSAATGSAGYPEPPEPRPADASAPLGAESR